MKIGQRGQVTIPKKIRERLGLDRSTEVEFQIVRGALVLRKVTTPKTRGIEKWTGFLEGRPKDVDEFIEEIRGR